MSTMHEVPGQDGRPDACKFEPGVAPCLLRELKEAESALAAEVAAHAATKAEVKNLKLSLADSIERETRVETRCLDWYEAWVKAVGPDIVPDLPHERGIYDVGKAVLDGEDVANLPPLAVEAMADAVIKASATKDAEFRRLQAIVDRMRAALKPFAAWGESVEARSAQADKAAFYIDGKTDRLTWITWSDIRAAAAAAKKVP